MKVVTAAQMAAIEQAKARSSVGADALMENSGLSVAQAARGESGGVAASASWRWLTPATTAPTGW